MSTESIFENILIRQMEINEMEGGTLMPSVYDEAVSRLSKMESLFGMNPNVTKYFEKGRLYYSYKTGGGLIGSIDTINYDERYADISNDFEKDTGNLVYHAIEAGSTLSLLFVSADPSKWASEQPTAMGVYACVVDTDTRERKYGYIRLDVLSGALIRNDLMVYSDMNPKNDDTPNDVKEEVLQRLEILKAQGLETDLDITELYRQGGETCISTLMNLWGISAGIVSPISARKDIEDIQKTIFSELALTPYFCIATLKKDKSILAFLYVSDEKKGWEKERTFLKDRNPEVILCDAQNNAISQTHAQYKLLNGGPVLTI